VSGENNTNQEAIAIIGMACVFPQAPDLETFWCNILNSVSAIGKPSPEWEAERYLDSNRINTSNGGYLKDLYRFDPREFGIMPNSVDGGEPDHFMALRVARDALLDAGYFANDYDHRDTGIVLGHSTYLHRGQGNLIQHHIVLDQTLELLQTVFPSLGDEKASEIRQLLKSKLPQYNADIAPGLVPNVMTGRIANRLNLRGPNYLIDGACSSSLLAINAAIDELRNGRSSLMLAGGVNASLPAEVSVIFTDLGALSEQGEIRPFDVDSDGTLLGEGLGVVVLKREGEALNDGDRIYAVIRGIGQASDGKRYGLLAPSVEGETLAIERAYMASGIDPATVDLLEAHGTGIPLGDKTEISALKNILGERKGAGGSVAIGSVKSMISHCIPAAGIAGLIKSALALSHKMLPPTLCNKVNPDLGIDKTPLYINTATRPWIVSPGMSRRAGINSFGFGGINTHAILEEAPAQTNPPLSLAGWPFELCVFSAGSVDALTEKLKQIEELLKANPDCRLAEIAAALLAEKQESPYRLAMVVKNGKDLSRKIKQVLKRISDNPNERWSTRGGVTYSCKPLEGKVAFMFPGEGSQYLGMFSDLALHFEEVREWFDFWRGLYNSPPGEARTDIIFPPESELTQQRQKELESRLHDMDVGSEAVFIGGQAMNSLLKSLGIEADVMVGHSSGESSALAASGAFGSVDHSQLAIFIRELNKVYQHVLNEGKIPTGALLTVGALSQRDVERHIGDVDKDIVIAMDNCTNQLVLFGAVHSIEKLQKTLSEAGGICAPLPFDRGYHTPLFSAVSEAFFSYYKRIHLKAPDVPLYSCASAELFSSDIQEVMKLAAGQWSTKVRFTETVEKMYHDGVRHFIEVGPSGNLTAFVNDILAGQEYLALPTDIRRKNSFEPLLFVLASLFVNNKDVRLQTLFESRSVKDATLQTLKQKESLGIPLLNTMPIIHLSDDEAATLQQMLPVSNEAIPSKVGKTTVKPGQNGSRVAESEQSVMSEYFTLMDDFLEQQSAMVEKFMANTSQRFEGSGQEGVLAPMLNVVTELDEQHCVCECSLSVYEDNFLRDHILSGKISEVDPELYGLSCVPLMVSLEIMAEACALIAGSKDVTLIENVKAFDWIALDKGELTLGVQAKAVSSGRKQYVAHIINDGNVVITADFSFEKSKCSASTPSSPDPVFSHMTQYSSQSGLSEPGARESTLTLSKHLQLTDCSTKELPPLSEKRKYCWEASELYLTGMFHGPIFQSIREINGWDDSGIDASLSEVKLDGFFTEAELPELVLNPVLLDAFGQLAAYWIAQQVGTDFNCFPSTIERIELYRQCPQNIQGLTLRARQQPLDPTLTNVEAMKSWQFECVDQEGQPIVRASSLVNVYYPVPNRFYEFRRDPLNGWLGQPYSTVQKEGVLLWQLPHLSEDFCAQSGGIFLRILASALLSYDERSEWQRVRTKKVLRQREWLLGRACIKEGIRYWIKQQTGVLLYPSDIEVLHDEKGMPYVDGWWRERLVSAPEISLSHNVTMSLAAVSAPGNRVGIDVEQVGRIQQPALVMESLNESERFLLRGFEGDTLHERLLGIWCAKEAASKYLGLGLQGEPKRYEVCFKDGDWERVEVRFKDTVINVKVSREQNIIIALATGNRSPEVLIYGNL